ncbi:CBS domain-containing protein [Stieleria sp. ICT_E10.1]|uniref:CBS domain-containing protein n=1 Tax=Stieleria sedimenti TaxID=2976331 RepID=UPI00217F9320|nr:CBS domain-containing protein [Stieleria sedimenti]MCS7469264.1 CBS domain-containing protein [Stieleria sedimenti]
MTTIDSNLETKVQSVMQRHPVTIHDYQTVHDAVDAMTEHHVSALPVVDEGHYLKGILTLNDLVRLVQDAERTLESDLAIYDTSYLVADIIRETLGTDEVASVMSGVMFKVKQEDTLKSAAKLMIEHQLHHLPVVGKDMKLLGILSSMDFVRLVADGT